MRKIRSFILEDKKIYKNNLLSWSEKFTEAVWLDSNDYPQKTSNFEAVLAVDAFTAIKTDFTDAFGQLKEYQELTADWLFGYLSYDLKNDVEELTSDNFDGLLFPDLYFFQPSKIIFIKNNEAVFHYLNMVEDEMEHDFEEIQNIFASQEGIEAAGGTKKQITPRISKQEYLEKIEKVLQYIHHGDIYEANICQEFYVKEKLQDPLDYFKRLNNISGSPFAAYLKFDGKFLLSASPERYITKTGNRISSQPIKGTARRAEDPKKDAAIAEALSIDHKEMSENIMIVDLVRNDLSRVANKGSVTVEELCKVYTFQQVHQLISTVSAEVDSFFSPVDILKATFPMGSMTGAPKISAMKIIEEIEETKRGLYSGALGYFTPQGDFDFNVVIRSILYNSVEKYISFSVGGAITANSVPEKECEECLIKAKAMLQVLQ